MSEPKKPLKTSTKPPAKIERAGLKLLQEFWPKTEDGRLCARLLQRYMFTRLVDTARGAECNPITAPSEAGANKAHAQLVEDFSTLATEQPPAPTVTKLPTLHRHADTQKP